MYSRYPSRNRDKEQIQLSKIVHEGGENKTVGYGLKMKRSRVQCKQILKMFQGRKPLAEKKTIPGSYAEQMANFNIFVFPKQLGQEHRLADPKLLVCRKMEPWSIGKCDIDIDGEVKNRSYLLVNKQMIFPYEFVTLHKIVKIL